MSKAEARKNRTAKKAKRAGSDTSDFIYWVLGGLSLALLAAGGWTIQWFGGREKRADESWAQALEHQQKGELTKAGELYEKAAALYEKLDRPENLARTYSNLGVVLRQQGDFAAAEQAYAKALAMNERLNDSEGKASVYSNLGNLRKDQKNYAGAVEAYEKALEIYQQLNRNEDVAKAKVQLGTIHLAAAGFESAKEAFSQALDVLGESKDTHLLGFEAHRGLGEALFHLREFEEATKHLNKALDGFDQAKLSVKVAETVELLGDVFYQNSDLGTARSCFEKAVEFWKTLDNMTAEAEAVGKLANVIYWSKEPELAETTYRKALDLHTKLGDTEGMARQHAGLGGLFLKDKKLDKAEAEYLIALELNKKIGRTQGMALAYGNLAKIRDQLGDRDKAKEYGKRLVELLMELGDEKRAEGVSRWLATLDQDAASTDSASRAQMPDSLGVLSNVPPAADEASTTPALESETPSDASPATSTQ